MTVKLRRSNPHYRDLTPGQPYVVIGIEGDEFRILNDAGKPYLYPPGLDFFVAKPKAAKTFWRIVNQRLATLGEVA